MSPVIRVEDVVLPTDFVINEIKQLDSITGCSVKFPFNEGDTSTCRICCD